jgi:hypothetical protein
MRKPAHPVRTTLTTFVALSTTLALVLAFAASASAATKERIGNRIHLGHGLNQTFPADQPFHITHGVGLDPGVGDGDAIGRYEIGLAWRARCVTVLPPRRAWAPALHLS